MEKCKAEGLFGVVCSRNGGCMWLAQVKAQPAESLPDLAEKDMGGCCRERSVRDLLFERVVGAIRSGEIGFDGPPKNRLAQIAAARPEVLNSLPGIVSPLR